MKGCYKVKTSLFIFSFLCCSLITASKLNVPRVLLPIFNKFSNNFTLEVVDAASGGCYKWTTSRPKIAQLLPVGGGSLSDCMSKVIVTAVTKERVRNTAIVFAEEINSGQVLRCDVIVDVIASLAIVTTTRELFREEAPEAFEVRAYDDQGNEFTTLEGIQFEWSIISWNQRQEKMETSQNDVLRFINFKDSPYETPNTVMSLDNLGLQGHIVLIEGSKIGSAKVSVRLPQEEYSNIPPIEVELMIVANLLIIPSDVHILPGDSVKFQIYEIQHGKLEEIVISHQFYLEVEDNSICSLDKNLNTATGLKQGKTKVLLHDRNVNAKETGIKVPSASVTVTDAAYINLDILPHHNWAVLLEDYHEVVVEIFDRENHKLSIGDGVKVTTVIPEEYFEIQTKSLNGTYIYGTSIEVGTAQVHSTLESVTDLNGRTHSVTPKISAQAKLMIYKQIGVTPSEVFLPWNPSERLKYEVKLQASGGDGNFIWKSRDNSVAVVSQSGVVRTLNSGHVEISAAMEINHNNYAVSNFYILPPQILEIVEYVAETEVGSSTFLHIAMFAQRPLSSSNVEKVSLAAFTQCTNTPFEVHIWDNVFSYNDSLKTPPVGTACSSLGITAIDLGTTKVTVSYTLDELTLEDTVTVSSYRPLTPINPGGGVVVLAVGAARTIVFSGGPRPWAGHTSEHSYQLVPNPSEIDVLDVIEIGSASSDKPHLYAYRVVCKRIGEVDVTVTVTNKPALKFRRRSESTATVKVYCAKPRYISLVSDIKLVDEERCPINFQQERMVVQNYEDVKVAVVIKDELGHVFDNVSTLNIDWMVSDSSLGVFSTSDMFFENYEADGYIFPFRQYQILKPKGKSGVLDITASIIGYNIKMLKHMGIVPEYPPFPVRDQRGYESTPEIMSKLSLLLVGDTIVTPNHYSVFNHPDNIIELKVSQGTGYYEIVLSSEEIADVTYTNGSRAIEIIPKTDGNLKVAILDLCLPLKPALAEIQISSVGSIKVEVAEHVEKGRSIPAVVHLFDTQGNILPVPDISLLNLRPLLDTAIVTVKLQENKDTGTKAAVLGQMHYVVTGLQLGDINLIFACGFQGNEVFSHPAPIQVFPPLKLLPRNITLVVGSIYQINSHGGPRPTAHVEYTVSSTSVVTVDSTGLVEGYGQGKALLVGKAVAVNKITGQRIVFSKDSVEIHVIPLAGIKIYAPLSRIIVGATMPIWAHGIPEELSPLIIGSAHPSLQFKWAISPSYVAQINNIYHKTGIELKDEDKVSMRLTALRAGMSTIYLNVTVPPTMSRFPHQQTVKFETRIDIEIMEELHLMSPNLGVAKSPFVLMTPDTEIQLKTNYEGDVEYTVLGSSDAGQATESSYVESIDQAVINVNPIIIVNKDGLIRSQSATGRSVVMVSVKEGCGLKQVLVVTVEVKPVHYIMANFEPRFRVAENEVVSVLPKGTTVKFTVSYHDNTGLPFTAVHSDIKLRTNRFDLLQLGKTFSRMAFLVDLDQESSTMLRVWDDLVFHHSTDYIKLIVGDIVLPSVRTLTLGDIICFSIPLLSPDGRIGHWKSAIPNVLSFDTGLNMGRVRAVDDIAVHHILPNVDTRIELKILPITQVKILPMKGDVLTNSHIGHSYRIPVILYNEFDKTETTSLHVRNGTSCPEGYVVTTYPFFCYIRFSNRNPEFDIDLVFTVDPAFDFKKGIYVCEIFVVDDASPKLSTFETNVFLTVETAVYVTGQLTIPFMPAIYVSTPEIYLSDVEMSGTLVIHGIAPVLQQVKVETENKHLKALKHTDQTQPKTSVYQVILSEEFWRDGELSVKMNVSIVSELTNQNVQVPVKLRLKRDKTHLSSPCLVNHFTSWGTFITDGLYNYRYFIAINLLLILLGTLYNYRYTSVSSSGRRGETILLPQSNLMAPRRQPNFDSPGNSSGESNLTFRAPFTDNEPVYGDPRVTFQNSHRRRFL